jgi:hypothetical protein
MSHVRRASGGVFGVEKQSLAKAAPRELGKKNEKDDFRATMEVKHRKELARLGPP